LPLPFAGLNFAINAMVTPPFARKCKNRNDEAHDRYSCGDFGRGCGGRLPE
jgi:hypothetical protein